MNLLVDKFIHLAGDSVCRRDIIKGHLYLFINVVIRGKIVNMFIDSRFYVGNNLVLGENIKYSLNVLLNGFA